MNFETLSIKYRSQRDVLAEGLVKIVNEDAEGKGYFAQLAMKALEKMAEIKEEQAA